MIFNSLWAIYIGTMQLSLVQISSMSIVITATVVLAEIPTGIVADVYSRRASVIIGGVLIGSCYTLIGAFPVFWVSLIAAFIEAVGDSFVSGALQAWITDEVSSDKVGPVFLRSSQISAVAHWAGIATGITLAALYSLLLPVLIGGLLWFVLSAFLIAFMPERGFHPSQQRKSFKGHFKDAIVIFKTGAQLVRNNTTLRRLFIIQVLLTVFFDSMYRLSRAHFLRSFNLPVITLPFLGTLKENAGFGGLEAVQGLLGIIGAEGIRRRVDLSNARQLPKALLSLYGIVVIGVFAFALTGQFPLAIAAWLLANVGHQLAEPITSTWLNQNIPSETRSTVLSMSSQASMMGTLVGNPSISAIGDRFGLRSGLLITGLLLAPVLGLLGRATQSEE